MSPPQEFDTAQARLALRINDAAVAVGLSRSTLYKLIREGNLRSVKVAGRRLIPIASLQALVAEIEDEVLP